MADQSHENSGAEVDFEHHARDYSRVMSMLKWGAIASFIIAMLVVLIISN